LKWACGLRIVIRFVSFAWVVVVLVVSRSSVLLGIDFVVPPFLLAGHFDICISIVLTDKAVIIVPRISGI
jgi:hypothetical protein